MSSILVLALPLFAILCHLPQIRSKIESSVTCGNRLPAYMVSDNNRLESTIDYVFQNVTEFDCTYTCSDNRDKKGERASCGSFNYIHRNKTCFIYKDRASPIGSKVLAQDVKHRYFEKFCLPDGSPLECGESNFLRADQHVLNGFAINVTRTKQLDKCIQACLELNGLCKSVMFFYEVEECIMNSGSSQDSEEGLVEEVADKVVYIENGCLFGKNRKTEANKKKPEVSVKPEVLSEKPQELEENVSITPTEKVGIEKVTEEPHPGKERGSFIVDQKRIEKGEEKSEGNNNKSDDLNESSTITNPTTVEATSTEQAVTVSPSTVEQFLSSTIESKPEEGSTEQSVSVTAEDDQKQGEIVSSWSQWSECDRPDGRQVRRRDCKANSKLCRGKLIESRSCLATTTIAEEDVTTLQRRSTTWKPPSDEPPTGAWTVWSKKCQPFPKGVPCDKGKKVGFQTRQCLGTPFECHGPFMRYCFLSC